MDEGRWKNREREKGWKKVDVVREDGRIRLALWGENVEKRWVDLWLRKTLGLSNYTCK